MFSFKFKAPVLLSLAICIFVVLAAACGNGQERSNQAAPQTPQPPQTLKVSPADAAKIGQLSVMADDMYKLTMSGSYVEARSRLLDMGMQITRIHFEGATTVEGVHALTDALTEAKRTFNAVNLSEEQAKLSAARMKLAVDALTHKNEPMWLQYDRVLQEDLTALEKAVAVRDAKSLQSALVGFKRHYDTVRPAIIISKDEADVEKVDSLITFISNQSSAVPLPVNNLQQGIGHLHEELDRLFGKEDKSAYVPLVDQRHPILWTVVIGSIIATILAYAAWQMFRDGRSEVSIRRKGQG